MKMKHILFFFLSANSLFAQVEIPPGPFAPPPVFDPYGRNGNPGAPFSGANAAAMHFLNIVDNQGYHGAWLDSGGIVHDVVSQEVWAAGMRAVRLHKGRVLSRKVVNHHAVNSLPGGVTGQIMVIEYETQFSNGTYETETLTVMSHPPAGVWRVINYRTER